MPLPDAAVSDFSDRHFREQRAPRPRPEDNEDMNASLTDEMDRVRRHTTDEARAKIDDTTRRNIRRFSSEPAQLHRRLAALEQEWDVERTLEANASTLALTGAVLGTTVSKKWFWLTGGVLGFLFQHATSGWCPPLPILRKLGVRTRSEIDREKYALKSLRGDFDDAAGTVPDPERTLHTVSTSESARENRQPDPVRRYTHDAQNARLDDAMARRVRLYASQPAEVIAERIRELRREWSIERYLQINVAAVGLTTAALAVGKNRKWGYVTCTGLAFFLFHAVEGFDPPLPLLRQAGLRSRAEIDREIYALKILRGDFNRATAAEDRETRMAGTLNAVGL